VKTISRIVLSCLVVLTVGRFASGKDPDASDALDIPDILDSGIKPGEVENRPYLDYARECIDLLIQYGADRYGKVHTPILVSILDVRTRECPQNPLPLDEDVRVIRRGRRAPAGANLYMDQPTIRAMYDLTRVTGESKYADFARKSIAYYLKHFIDDKGLIWWGWHRHVDVYTDEMTGHLGNHHEIHIQEAIWPILWEINPQAVRREIEAIWKWHVIDKTTGEINRHDDGKRGCDFAFTGGEIAYAFAFLYTKTQDRQWLDRAKLLADYYWKARDRRTNLIPERPNAGTERFDGAYFAPSVVGMHCRSLLAIFEMTGEPQFRDYALTYMKAYGTYGWDTKATKFWASVGLDGTPDTRPRSAGSAYDKYQGRGHVDCWQPYVAGFECPLFAPQVYAYAYELTKDEDMLETARRWANSIRHAWPPRRCADPSWYSGYARSWAKHGTYADNYGRIISFLLHMHALTGEGEYLVFARTVANEAIAKLYYRGLFRGHPCKPYYEAVDGVGFLLRSLIQLHQVKTGDEQNTLAIRFANW